MTTEQEATTRTTAWKSYKRPYRPRLYLNAVTGEGATEDGGAVHLSPGMSLRELARAIPARIETLYLCGQLPSAPGITAANGELYSGFNSWLLSDASILERLRLDSGEAHDQMFAWVRHESGALLGVYTAASWFSTNDLTPLDATRAHKDLTRALQRQSGWQEVYLLDSPARTGLDLWRVSIGRHTVNGRYVTLEYPILPDGVRVLIRATSGQGRFELLPPPAGSDGYAPALNYLDKRLAYGAPSLGELGIGPVTHDEASDYAGWQPARYRVAYQVPDGWAHLGLFMTKDPTRQAGWVYPRIPGETGETWLDASELRIALGPFPHNCADCERCYAANDGSRCPQHGWPFTIRERLLFTKGRPLHTWAEKLIAARDNCYREHAAAAIRNILLHTVGAFHDTPRPTTHYGAAHEAPNGVALDTLLLPDGEELYAWQLRSQEPPTDSAHPELSSQVWARTRAGMLLHRPYGSESYIGALTLPFEQIVALRLDALYSTVDPGWPDNGGPGAFRLKGHLSGPLLWPREEWELASVKEQCEGIPT
jgi:hypothetical protein